MHTLVHASVGFCSSIRCSTLAFYRHVEIPDDIDVKIHPTLVSSDKRGGKTDVCWCYHTVHTVIFKATYSVLGFQLDSCRRRCRWNTGSHALDYWEVKTRATGTATLQEGGVGERAVRGDRKKRLKGGERWEQNVWQRTIKYRKWLEKVKWEMNRYALYRIWEGEMCVYLTWDNSLLKFELQEENESVKESRDWTACLPFSRMWNEKLQECERARLILTFI